MNINPMDLSGKRILITGASSGIGRATAHLFSRLGAMVVLLARSEERLNNTLNGLEGKGHGHYMFDLAYTDDIPGLLKKVSVEQGPLSGLFHAAGIMIVKPVSIVKSKDIAAVFDSSVKATLLLSRGFFQKGVYDKAGGSLVFMSSVAGLRGKLGLSVYSASKAAVDGAVRSLAVELAPRGIRVNSIAAGGVQTEMHDQIAKNLSEEAISAYAQKHLLGFGSPEDIAQAAAFLMSDASKWITGTTMIVDGGYSCT
jgi:NAD(P)-dependent dehydrogenase (short-subunit alcohol dehydrogenase family)